MLDAAVKLDNAATLVVLSLSMHSLTPNNSFCKTSRLMRLSLSFHFLRNSCLALTILITLLTIITTTIMIKSELPLSRSSSVKMISQVIIMKMSLNNRIWSSQCNNPTSSQFSLNSNSWTTWITRLLLLTTKSLLPFLSRLSLRLSWAKTLCLHLKHNSDKTQDLVLLLWIPPLQTSKPL